MDPSSTTKTKTLTRDQQILVNTRIKSFITITDGHDTATTASITAFAVAAAINKLSKTQRYPKVIHQTSQVEPSYIPLLLQKVEGYCDFHGCLERALYSSTRCDIARCGKHMLCCVVFGCALPAEFRIRQYRNRCAIHGGIKECVRPTCEKVGRELSGLCGEHEIEKNELHDVACTYEGCSAGKWDNKPNYRICGGLFQRCAKHGGEWFCREPGCIRKAEKTSGAALLCSEHHAPVSAALTLPSVCRWLRGANYCTNEIDGRGSKREGLCSEHFRILECERCGAPNACSATQQTQACQRCMRHVKRDQLRSLLEHKILENKDVDACGLCNKPKLSWWEVCLECVGRDQCVGCYGPKTKNAEYCRTCRTEYNKLLFKLEESKFAALLQHATEDDDCNLSLYGRYSARDMKLSCCSERGCRRRPDFLYVLPNHAVIVELDEGYHAGYSLQQELDRVVELATSLQTQHGLGLHVVRVNAQFYDIDTVLRVVEAACTTPAEVYMNNRVLLECIGYPLPRYDRLKEKEGDDKQTATTNIVVAGNHEPRYPNTIV